MEHYTCVICQKKCFGYGNNPVPLKPDGKCCDKCNIQVVIARIMQTKIKK